MKKATFIICAFVMFAFALSVVSCHRRIKSGYDLRDAMQEGWVLLYQSPIDYNLNPTRRGNAHLRSCIVKEANKLAKQDGQRVTVKLRYEEGLTEETTAFVAILEDGRIGIEILKDGEELYAKYHDFSSQDAVHACETFRRLRQKASRRIDFDDEDEEDLGDFDDEEDDDLGDFDDEEDDDLGDFDDEESEEDPDGGIADFEESEEDPDGGIADFEESEEDPEEGAADSDESTPEEPEDESSEEEAPDEGAADSDESTPEDDDPELSDFEVE